jgi:predicted lipid-binding transport protein (Tim44 family)
VAGPNPAAAAAASPWMGSAGPWMGSAGLFMGFLFFCFFISLTEAGKQPLRKMIYLP